jgi:alpha-N-acetylglucosamine transferase
MDSVTAEKVEALLKSRDAKAAEHAALLSKSGLDLWKQDLCALKDAYGAYVARRREEATASTASDASAAAIGKDKGKGKGRAKQQAKKG